MKTKILVIPAFIIAFMISIDQCVKYWITKNFLLYETKEFIPKVFDLTYIQNKGVAWGLFQGKIPVFLVMTTIILIMAAYVYYNISGIKRFLPIRISLVVLIAGAVGNMIDRIKLGYVIDFLDFKSFDFPIFNIADIYVVISMIALFIMITFVYGDKDIDLLLGIKKDSQREDELNENEIE